MDALFRWWPVLLLGIGIGSWAVAQEIGQVTLEKQVKTIASGVVQLQQRHISDDAKEEGRREEQERIRVMCDDGRVTGDICEE